MSNQTSTQTQPTLRVIAETETPIIGGDKTTVIVHHRNEYAPWFQTCADGAEVNLEADYTKVVSFGIHEDYTETPVEASDVFSAIFFQTNHIDSDWADNDPCTDITETNFMIRTFETRIRGNRSTSAGDIYEIVWEDGTSDFFIVNGVGWKQVVPAFV